MSCSSLRVSSEAYDKKKSKYCSVAVSSDAYDKKETVLLLLTHGVRLARVIALN